MANKLNLPHPETLDITEAKDDYHLPSLTSAKDRTQETRQADTGRSGGGGRGDSPIRRTQHISFTGKSCSVARAEGKPPWSESRRPHLRFIRDGSFTGKAISGKRGRMFKRLLSRLETCPFSK